jgi:hypothetical protein
VLTILSYLCFIAVTFPILFFEQRAFNKRQEAETGVPSLRQPNLAVFAGAALIFGFFVIPIFCYTTRGGKGAAYGVLMMVGAAIAASALLWLLLFALVVAGVR